MKYSVFILILTMSCVCLHGQYKLYQSIELPQKINAFTIGDFNGDSNPDLAVCTVGKIIIIYYCRENKFPNYPDVAIPVDTSNIIAVDTDNDGTDEIVCILPKHMIGIYSIKDKYAKPVLSSNANQWTNYLVAGKIDSDSNCAILTGPARRELLKNSKHIRHSYFIGINKIRNNNQPCLFDLNGDGRSEVVFGLAKKTGIRLYYGIPQCAGNMLPTQFEEIIQLNTDELIIDRITAGDVNNDGRPDIIADTLPAYAQQNRRTIIFFQNSPMGFSENATPDVVLSDSNLTVVANFNSNEKSDLATANPRSGMICIYKAVSYGKFDRAPVARIRTGMTLIDFQAATIKGKDNVEIIVGGSQNGKNYLKIYSK